MILKKQYLNTFKRYWFQSSPTNILTIINNKLWLLKNAEWEMSLQGNSYDTMMKGHFNILIGIRGLSSNIAIRVKY